MLHSQMIAYPGLFVELFAIVLENSAMFDVTTRLNVRAREALGGTSTEIHAPFNNNDVEDPHKVCRKWRVTKGQCRRPVTS